MPRGCLQGGMGGRGGLNTRFGAEIPTKIQDGFEGVFLNFLFLQKYPNPLRVAYLGDLSAEIRVWTPTRPQSRSDHRE